MTKARDNASQGGLVLLLKTTLTGAATYDIINCFSATYDNYRVVFNATSGSPTAVRINLLSGTTPNTDAAYTLGLTGYNQVGSNKPVNQSNGTYWHLVNMVANPTSVNVYSDISSPFLTRHTCINSVISDEDDWYEGRSGAGRHNVSSSFDGIRFVSSGGNFGAIVSIYGYRK